jgi:hypothetical protein
MVASISSSEFKGAEPDRMADWQAGNANCATARMKAKSKGIFRCLLRIITKADTPEILGWNASVEPKSAPELAPLSRPN